MFLFTILLHLLGWHWLIRLYKFQVYNSIWKLLCIALCVFTTWSQVSLNQDAFDPLYNLLPSPTSLPVWYPPYCCLCLWVFLHIFYSCISVKPEIILIKMLMFCKGLHNFSFVCMNLLIYVIFVSKASVIYCSGLFLAYISCFSET